MTSDSSSIDAMEDFGILRAEVVAQLLKLRPSTGLDLSRRGVLPAFKIGRHWRHRRAELIESMTSRRDAAKPVPREHDAP